MSVQKEFRLISLLVVIVVLFACIAYATAGVESKPISCIVVPTEETPAEQHAANQLDLYINKMTGQKPVVIKEGEKKPAGRAIILGRTKDNLKKHNPDSWPVDTIYIGYGKADIAIIGQGKQGTLFAAYEFLHDQGCRWYIPIVGHKQEVGECIPQRQYLDLPEKPKKHTPSFQDRGWHTTASYPGKFFQDWAVRNCVNAITPGSTNIRYGPYLGYGREKQMGHTLRWFVKSGNHPLDAENSKKMFAAHPEWYPLVDGKRVWHYKDGRPVQACLSNPEVVELVAQEMIGLFQKGYEDNENPDWWLFSLGHNDEPSYWCECENCLAMDGPENTWRKNDNLDAYPDEPDIKNRPGPLSERYTSFVNQVARIVAKKLPEKYISFYAYGSTVAPPRDPSLKLEANVIAELAYSGHCLRHDIDAPECKYNINLSNWVKDWGNRGKVMFYDYPPTGYNIHIPTGFLAHYKQLLRHFKDNGVIGFSGESQGTFAGSALFHYVKARLLWDIDSDVDQLIHEFCRDMYGQAAATMERFYTTYEQKLMEYPGHMVWGGWVKNFDKDAIQTMQKLLDKAKGETDSPLVHRRLKMMQASMNCFVLTQMEAVPAAKSNAKTFDSYKKLQAETLKINQEVNLPFPLVVTGPYKDRLKSGSYRPPFEAIGGKELLTLPLVWRFRTDPDDEGLVQGWAKTPSADSSNWQDIRVDNYWTEQGINYHGVAWYATTIKIPDGQKEYIWLLFEKLDGAAEIWIDGQLAGKLPGAPWDKPKAVELTTLVEPGNQYPLVIRVVKDVYAAGICGPVKLMESYKIIGDR